MLSHGTTIGINAVLKGKRARSAILTTNGFKDVLELRRGARTHLLDPLMDKPPLFIPGRWRYEVKERVLWDGTVLVPLDEAELNGILEGPDKDALLLDRQAWSDLGLQEGDRVLLRAING